MKARMYKEAELIKMASRHAMRTTIARRQTSVGESSALKQFREGAHRSKTPCSIKCGWRNEGKLRFALPLSTISTAVTSQHRAWKQKVPGNAGTALEGLCRGSRYSRKTMSVIPGRTEAIVGTPMQTRNCWMAGKPSGSLRGADPLVPRAFQQLVESMIESKSHGKHSENINYSWEERRYKPSAENYESGVDRVMPSSAEGEKGKCRSITSMFQRNQHVFHRQKSISEYTNLCNIYLHNIDKHYAIGSSNSGAFRKTKGRFTVYSNAITIK